MSRLVGEGVAPESQRPMSSGPELVVPGMKALFPAIWVSDLDASLSFYRCVGYDVVGTVAVSVGTRLAMLALPEEAEVSLELVQWPDGHPVGMTRDDFPGSS